MLKSLRIEVKRNYVLAKFNKNVLAQSAVELVLDFVYSIGKRRLPPDELKASLLIHNPFSLDRPVVPGSIVRSEMESLMGTWQFHISLKISQSDFPSTVMSNRRAGSMQKHSTRI